MGLLLGFLGGMLMKVKLRLNWIENDEDSDATMYQKLNRELKWADHKLADVLYGWLFHGMALREMDQQILGLDSKYSRGFRAMEVLQAYGLHREFQGIFRGMRVEEGVAILVGAGQNFGPIIELLGLHGEGALMALDNLRNVERDELRAAKSLRVEERMKFIHESVQKPKKYRVYSYTYKRNPYIVAEALFRADGICEICDRPAPFLRASDQSPYLEVHHVIALAHQGKDSLDNVKALCPNCHRREHFG